MLTLILAFALAFVPHAAHAQRVTASASAKITTQQFSTKEFRTNANDRAAQEATKISGLYVQQNYQSEEKTLPCDKNEGRTKATDESGISANRPMKRSMKREEQKCLILMIELH